MSGERNLERQREPGGGWMGLASLAPLWRKDRMGGRAMPARLAARLRAIGDAFPRRPDVIDESPFEARRLRGVRSDRLFQFVGRRRQQPDIHERLACFANVSSKSSALISPRR